MLNLEEEKNLQGACPVFVVVVVILLCNSILHTIVDTVSVVIEGLSLLQNAFNQKCIIWLHPSSLMCTYLIVVQVALPVPTQHAFSNKEFPELRHAYGVGVRATNNYNYY